MAFRKLFLKEWRSILPMYGVFSAAVLLLHVLVLFKSGVWGDEIVMILSLFIPYLFAALITIGTGYYQLHSEWRTNSIYLLLSLPVRGWKVLTAKLTAALSLLILTSLWIGGSFILVLMLADWDDWRASEELPELFPTLLHVTASGFLLYCFTVAFLLIVVQFAFLCGQLVAKLKWLVILGAFLGALWLLLRLSPMLSGLLLWTPDLFIVSDDADILYLHSGPFIGLVLLGAGLVWLNGYIFEKEVEV
ncbi:hypothetical protein [Paenibacillus montanisoli]|uniref:Uncharacterized protein n=1 Tax=Paenibacillus montanisoli TaxID=2081970 RepID=A0A328U1N3_9BACL|nr:hypothetical protein [Paenibacillus montanisoli]RAP75673.1 hypothetical protein DL346_09445 [Paenibacillus montanisoli]